MILNSRFLCQIFKVTTKCTAKNREVSLMLSKIMTKKAHILPGCITECVFLTVFVIFPIVKSS